MCWTSGDLTHVLNTQNIFISWLENVLQRFEVERQHPKPYFSQNILPHLEHDFDKIRTDLKECITLNIMNSFDGYEIYDFPYLIRVSGIS